MKQCKLFACVFVLFLSGCSADPNAEANKLFVEAQKLIESSASQPPEDVLKPLLSAEERLNLIVSKYPSSNLAVTLARLIRQKAPERLASVV